MLVANPEDVSSGSRTHTMEGENIPNYGTNLEMPFPFVSPISSTGVGSLAALADTMISGGNLP